MNLNAFFLFLINFMALKIPLTYTSVITFYNKSKQKDCDHNSQQKMIVDYTHIVAFEFSVDPKDLFHIYSTLHFQLFACEITQSYEKNTTRVTYSLPNGS